jgi:hypothetical protein
MSTDPSNFFNDIGLPDGHAFPQLAYHHSTGTIIAHTRPLRSRPPSQRLSTRRVNEPRYTVVGDFPPTISISSFVLSPTLPLLYFITERWREVGDTVGGDWEGLHTFSLDTQQCDRVIQPGELMAQAPYKRAWLVGLLSVAQHGQSFFCRAALERESGAVAYWLSEVSLLDRRLTAIAKLETAFA